MYRAVITDIQGYSIHDGPGIRTAVFFKGCPLTCKWCANPECILGKPQMGFIASLCKHCGKCLDACRNNAIRSGDNEYRIDQSVCVSCGKCMDVCSYGALVRYGNLMTLDEVWDAVKRDKMFYNTSGGGVTVSGGEPLLHAGFVRELFSRCRKEQIGTCVETCGIVDPKNILEVMPVTDQFLFDLKVMDSEMHRKYTGQYNDKILENAVLIINHNAEVLFRQPLIPGVNDSDINIKATAGFLKNLGERASRLQIMPYHRIGQSKYNALDLEYYMEYISVMDNEEIESVKNAYIAHGIECTVSR